MRYLWRDSGGEGRLSDGPAPQRRPDELEPADRNEVIARYDPDEAAMTAFRMYDGERVVATIKLDADLMNVVVDLSAAM